MSVSPPSPEGVSPSGDAWSWTPRPFHATRWAHGPHAQTLMARLLRPEIAPLGRRERFETPDGDFLDVDWGTAPSNDAPLVLILHGLEGSSRRRYVRNVAHGLEVRGVQAVAMNFRGCSGAPNRALRFYHSGETEDPTWLLEKIRLRYPERALGVMGFSLGGNVALKMLGERDDGGRGLVDAAAVMSVPYDLSAGAGLLEESAMGGFYAAYFLRSLRKKLQGKRATLADRIDVAAAYRASTIRQFDDLVTAPLHGFADAGEYYALSSSNRFLPAIRVPTLLLHAVDDPFLPSDAIPRAQAEHNSALRLILHRRGGHVGFLEGSLRRPRFWGEESAASFLAAALGAA